MQYHESHFCPVTCSMADLSKAVHEVPDEARKAFLCGVWHARLAQQFADVGQGREFRRGIEHFHVIDKAARGGIGRRRIYILLPFSTSREAVVENGDSYQNT